MSNFLQREEINDYIVMIYQEPTPQYAFWVYPVQIKGKGKSFDKRFFVPVTTLETKSAVKKITDEIKNIIQKNLLDDPDNQEFVYMGEEFKGVVDNS